MNKLFKVAHILYGLPIGGVTSVIKQLLEKQNDQVEQILILLSATDEIPSDFPDVKIYKLNYSLPDEYSLKGFLNIWLWAGKYYNALVTKIAKIHEQEKFDIYHFHGIPKDLPIGTLLQRKCNGVKLIYTDHVLRIGDNDYSGVKKRILCFIYKQFYKSYNVIFVSKSIFTSANLFGFLNKRMRNAVIENSIDVEKILPKKSYTIGESISIGYVSRISAVKGHFTLVPVAEILIKKFGLKNFKFILIGPGEMTGQLIDEIQSRKLSDYFDIQGPSVSVGATLHKLDIAVFPSEREGLPIALLEKMAAGLPVVASDIHEIRNVIQNADETLLFPVNNSAACAQQLYNLIINQELREQIGKTARKAVQERYSAPLLEKYIAFYNSAL